MFKKRILFTLLIIVFFITLADQVTNIFGSSDGITTQSERIKLFIVGKVSTQNDGKDGIVGMKINLMKDGNVLLFEEKEQKETNSDGVFNIEAFFSNGDLKFAGDEITNLKIVLSKKGYVTRFLDIGDISCQSVNEQGEVVYYANVSSIPKRKFSWAFWISTIVLLVSYILIASEKWHRTLVAFLGGGFILLVTYLIGHFDSDFRIITFDEAIHVIDMNVIFLLMSMMINVGVLKKTGVFQWLAYKSFQLSRGNVVVMSVIIWLITAVSSAFLDNVTSVLLIIPIIFEICMTLKLNPIAVMIPAVFASNVGGTATLIGDPPNIMIGSFAELTFNQFVVNLAMPVLVMLAFSIVWYLFYYRKDFRAVKIENVDELIAKLKKEYRITNKTLLLYSIVIFGIVILLFVFHGLLDHMEPSIAAMLGAGVLLAISKLDVVEIFEKEVEWATLVFFMFLFIIVGGTEETGLIQWIAESIKTLAGTNLLLATMLVLWVAAIASSLIDNIPFTATMLPIVYFLSNEFGSEIANVGANPNILWWALALGACLGGNGTLIGASANVVTVGVAERYGYNISFLYYIRACFVPMLITCVIASLWLILFEL